MSSVLSRSSPSAYSRKKSPNVLRGRQALQNSSNNYQYDNPANQTFLSNNEQSKQDELKQQNDQLYSELRKAKEKCLDVRVENNKLKEQNQQLKNQVETFKVKEAASRAASVGRTRRSTQRTTTTKGDSANMLSLQCIESTGLLCIQVTSFLTAMKALQRAVTNKDKDITNYKQEFEGQKKQLEKLASTVKQQLEQLPAGGASRDMGNRCSSSSDIQKIKSNQGSRTTLSSSQTPSHFSSTLRDPIKRSAKKEHSQEVESRLSMSTKQIRSLKVEKDKQKELLEELRLANKQYATLNAQLKSKAMQLQNVHKKEKAMNQEFSQILNEHAQALKALNTDQTNKLLSELIERKKKIDQSVSKQVAQEVKLQSTPTSSIKSQSVISQKQNNLANDESDQNKQQISQLKNNLVNLINQKEKLMTERLRAILIRLANKERDLDTLKKLFVDKLRELENSFAEISQEVIQNDTIQQELEKKSSMSVSNNESKPFSEIENTVERALVKIEQDSREEEITKLIQANQELMETNGQLKNNLKKFTDSPNSHGTSNFEDTENIIKLNEQLEILQNTNQELSTKVKQQSKVESTFKKETQSMKYENRRVVSDYKEQIQKLKESFSQQQYSLMFSNKQLKQSEAIEKETRMKLETQYVNVVKSKQIAMTEKSKLETELEQVHKAFEDYKKEYAYLDQLKDESKGAQTMEDNSEEPSISKENEQKITDDPKQAAQDFLKELNAVKKELSISEVNQNKLLQSITSQKEQLNELKTDNREMTQDNVNMQNKMFELNGELARFREQQNKEDNNKSDDTSSQETRDNQLRESIKAELAPQLEFKTQEVEAMKQKLGKLSETVAEQTTKLDRLSKAKTELEQENIQLTNQVRDVEMELMLAKQKDEDQNTNQNEKISDEYTNQQETD